MDHLKYQKINDDDLEEDKIKYIDITDILISEPILKAINLKLKEKSDELIFDLHFNGFRDLINTDQGLPLSRLENIFEISKDNFPKFLEKNPIIIEFDYYDEVPSSPKSKTWIRKNFYSIINGRHRFVRAVIDGLSKIPVIIKKIDD